MAEGIEIGTAYVSLTASAAGFGSKLNQSLSGEISGPADRAGKQIEASLGGSFKKVAGIAAASIGGALAGREILGFLKGSVEQARESNKIAAQTAAVLKSTGGVAGVTAKQVDSLANSIAAKTGIDDEAISSAENLLLTFTNIRDSVGKNNDIFDQATRIAVDMGAALGGDASSNAIQLGKALNDPVQGISALTRVGVSFTAQQKDQIKAMQTAGDLAGAQKIILGELNKEFGGSAAAQATASQRLKVVWGNLQEQLGNKLIPIIDKAATFLADRLPGAVDSAMAGFTRLQQAVGPTVARIVGAFKATADFLVGTVWPAIQTFAAGVSRVFGSMVDYVRRIWPQISEAISHVVNVVAGIIRTFVDVVSALWRAWGDDLAHIAATVWNGIRETIDNALQLVRGIIQTVVALINGDWGKAWDGLKNIVGAVWDEIGNIISTAIGVIRGLVGGIGSTIAEVAKGMWDPILDGLKAVLRAVINAWNALDLKVPKVHIPGTDVDFGGFDLIPDFPMPGFLGGGTTGGAGKPATRALAIGGPFNPWDNLLVGERGPEMVRFDRGGTVVPNAALGSTTGSPAPPITMVFNEKVDPLHVAKAISWQLAG